MSRSAAFDQLHRATKETAFWRDLVRATDLYVSLHTAIRPGRYMLLNRGARVVPYVVRAGVGDPQEDPAWSTLLANYRPAALDYLAARGYATRAPGSEPQPIAPPTQIFEFDDLYQGEFTRGSQGNDYWTESELREQLDRVKEFGAVYKEAISWWMLLHGLNPDAITPYPDEARRVLALIEQKEAGDKGAAALLEITSPAAPMATPASQSGMRTQAAQSSPADLLKKYWVWGAAAGVVGIMFLRKKKGDRG